MSQSMTPEAEVLKDGQALPMWIWGTTAFIATYALMFVIR